MEDHLLIVESRFFTARVLLDCYSRCKGKGLARELLPYMVDLLKRQQSLGALTDSETMAQAGHAIINELTECLPEEYFEWTHKEMFISLLEITPPSIHNRLASLAVSIGCSVPFLYRRILPNGFVGMRMTLDACKNLLGGENRPLVLSCGTSLTTAGGKSDLMGELLGLSKSLNSGLSVDSTSPCHNLSIDLLFDSVLSQDSSANSIVLADAHRFSSESFGFCTAIGVLMSVASMTVLHVTKNDFTDFGEAKDEVKQYCDSFVKYNQQFGKQTGSCLVLVWRDYTDKDKRRFETVERVWLAGALAQTDGLSLKLVKIANLSKLKGIRRTSQLENLRQFFLQTIRSHYGECLPTSCRTTEIIRRMNEIAKTNPLFVGVERDMCLPLYTERRIALMKVESQVKEALDRGVADLQKKGGNKLRAALFPLLTLKTDYAQQEEEMRHLAATRDINDETVAGNLVALETSMKSIEELMALSKTSFFVREFSSFVRKGDLEAIDIIQQALTEWKMPKCKPLLLERQSLRVRLERRVGELRHAGKEEKDDVTLKDIRNELKKNENQLDAFDVSIDDVWSELISLADVELNQSHRRRQTIRLIDKECNLPREQLAKTYRDWIMKGNPMQLLRGAPLYMASKFISSILRLFQEESNRRVFVVSVIGMQSSAKSTLLNYLFGCGFVTRAGRCTRGLYASYMRTSELDLLILDSEGLMSVEGEGRDFDNKITLMAMACSHAVIVNHKGELSKQLQELLEVAVFAMKNLEVVKLPPDVLFVLRDQLERTSEDIQGQLIQMQQGLSDMAEKLSIDVNHYLNLHADSLILLPVAFASETRNGREINLPTSLFSNDCIRLRRKLFELHREKVKHVSDVEEFSSLQQWSVHARSVWTTIRHFGASLLQFENMQQIEQRREVASVLDRIVKEHIDIEAPGGYTDQCRKQLQSYFSKSSSSRLAELTHLGSIFKTELNVNANHFKEKVQKHFSAALEAGQYNPSWKSLFSHRLNARIDEITAMYVRNWDARERVMKEQMQAEGIEKSLVERINRTMRERKMTTVMSTDELEKAFDEMWRRHFNEVHSDLKQTRKTEEEIGKEVYAAFQAVFSGYTQLNDPVYTVVALNHRVPQLSSLIMSQTIDFYKDYVHHKVFARVKNRVHGITRNVAYKELKDVQKEEAAYWLKQGVWSFFKDFPSGGARDLEQTYHAFVKEAVEKTRDVILRLNEQLTEKFEMTVRMPPFVNDMVNCLMFRCVSVIAEKQKAEVQSKVDDLKNKKEKIRERCKVLLRESRDDVGCAKYLVRDILGGLIDWCRTEIIEIVVEVENRLRKMIPDWPTAARIAFEESFLKEDWTAVLDYCENASAFTRSLFDKRYNWLEMDVVSKELPVVKERILEEQAFLRKIVSEWGDAREMTSSLSPGMKTSDLVEFARSRRRNAPAFHSTLSVSSAQLNVSLDVLQFIPQDVGVRDPTRFAQSFVGHLDERLNRTPTASIMEDMLRRDIAASKESFWKGLRGCSKQCPICDSMCDQEEGHLELGIKHSCQEHLLPAFHGSRNPMTKEPIFQLCTSAETQKMPWRSRENPDHSRDSLARYLKDFHADWNIPTSATAPQLLKLRRAWVKCRKPILRMKEMVDSTPIQWIRQFGGSDELSADVKSSFSKGIGASKAP